MAHLVRGPLLALLATSSAAVWAGSASLAAGGAGDVDLRSGDAGPEPVPVVVPPDARGAAEAPVPVPAPDPTARAAQVDPRAQAATPDPVAPAPVSGAEPAAAGVHPAVDASAPTPDGTLATADPAAEPAAAAAADGGALQGPSAGPPRKTGMGFGGVPAVNYDSDNGFGFGVIATLYGYDGETDPYRIAVTLQIFLTTKLVQDHNVQVDWLKAFDLPLRLNLRVGYLQSLTQNYCGFGGDVSCDPDVARAAGKDAGLSGASLDRFEREYYQRRFMNPYGLLNARLMLWQAPGPRHLRVELLGGYRGFYFIPGNWFDDRNKDGDADLFPYPGSLYAEDFPAGEGGYSSVLQAGVLLDTRDNEPAATEGVFAEATLRGSSPVWGSSWSWAGGNLSIRGFVPLLESHKLVLASRLVLDGVVGDPPVQELARMGGTVDYYAFGGGDMGRGIRVQRFIGKLRVLNQTEVRWRFFDFSLLDQNFGLTLAGMVDSGIVGREIADPGPMPLNAGFGGGLRVAWNENFVVRFEAAASPVEDWAPNIYVLVNNPF